MNTVQNILQQFETTYLEHHALSPMQAKAYRDILNCRSAALGANAFVCGECGHTAVHYNSCRNRHCPSCQGLKKEIWIDKRSKDILNAPYFHVVFTLPQELQRLIYQNQFLLYNLMYKASAQTILELCADTKYLGAQVGFFSLLHTWAQDLHYHPHIHMVLLAGGLTNKAQWRSSCDKFFLPVKVMAKKFRGKFLCELKKYYMNQRLQFYGDMKQYQTTTEFRALLNQCYSKNWYTYTKRTFSGPLAVMKYLGRYTHRVALSNKRIVAIDQECVTFTVKDRIREKGIKNIRLSGVEFVRRFLMHVLPKGFVKIRYYGLLANRNKKSKLELSRALSKSPTVREKFKGLESSQILLLLTGKDITLCPVCREGKLKLSYTILPGSSP